MNKIVVDRDTMHWYGEPPCIPCGQQLFSQFEFSLSEDWDNANILAQFKQGDTLLNVAVTENTCYVPYGLNPGTAYLRLRGTFERNSEVIATVNELQFNLVQGFEPGGSPSVPPTPDLYQKLIQSIQHTEFRVGELAEQAQSSAEVAKADANRVTKLAEEVSAKAAQAAQDATESVQAKEAAQTAQHLAETAQQAAEAAKRSAEAAKVAVAQSATDAEAAKQGAETAMQAAQDAAESAAQALENIQELYQQMQTWAQGVIQDVHAAGSQSVQSVQDAGDAQVKRVAEEGTTQTANAKAQADAAAKSAQEAAESAAVYDEVVTNVTQLKQDIAAITPDDTAVNGKPWTSKNIVDSLCQPIEENGNPVQCYPVENYPLGVKLSWEPVQEGEGDPSPDNIRPITGRDAVSVTRCSKNLLDLDLDAFNKASFWNKVNIISPYLNRIKFKPNTQYTISLNATLLEGSNAVAYLMIDFTDGTSMSYGNSVVVDARIGKDGTNVITSHQGKSIKHMRYISGIDGPFTLNSIQIEEGATPTTYEQYTGSTTDIALPETVYGGTLDVESGEGQEMWKMLTLDGTERWQDNGSVPDRKEQQWALYKILRPYPGTFGISSHFGNTNSLYKYPFNIVRIAGDSIVLHVALDGPFATVGDLKAYLAAQYAAGTPVQVCYKLAEPVPFNAAGAQPIHALSGVNTIYTDADGVVVTGAEDPKHTITELKNAIISLGGNV